MTKDLVIGIDCSTTAAKAVVWDASGRAVAVGRRGYHTALGFEDFEPHKGSGPIAEGLQLFLECEQLRFQPGVEGQHSRAIALGPLGPAGGGVQIGEAGEARIEILEWAHGHGHQPIWRRCWPIQPLSCRLTACSSLEACS